MRILYVWYDAPGWFTRDAPPVEPLEKAGHTVKVHNAARITPTFLGEVAEFNPEFIFFEYHPIALDHIESTVKLTDLQILRRSYPNTRMGLWCEDVRDPLWDKLTQCAHLMDVVLINHDDPRHRNVWRQAGFTGPLYTMYGSVRPETYHDPAIEPMYDVVFAGKNYRSAFPRSAQRHDFIYQLSKQTTFSFALAGDGWEDLKMPNYKGELKSAAAVGKFLQEGRVILGTNHYDLNGYYPKRWWEALAVGRAIVYREIPGSDQSEFDVVAGWFRLRFDDLMDQIRKELPNWKIQGDANRDLFMTYYTWEHQMRPLLEYLERIQLQSSLRT